MDTKRRIMSQVAIGVASFFVVIIIVSIVFALTIGIVASQFYGISEDSDLVMIDWLVLIPATLIGLIPIVHAGTKRRWGIFIGSVLAMGLLAFVVFALYTEGITLHSDTI